MEEAIAQALKLHDGIWDAYRVEEMERELLYLNGKFNVAGVYIPAMNGRSYNMLCAMANPYVFGGREPTIEDACRLIWTVRLQLPFPWWQNWRSISKKRNAFLRKVDLSRVLDDVSEYVDLIFLDAPKGDGGGRSGDSIAASVAYVMAPMWAHYGWDEGKVLDAPVPIIYQKMKLIRRKLDPDAKFRPGPKVKQASRSYFKFLNQNKLSHADVFSRN